MGLTPSRWLYSNLAMDPLDLPSHSYAKIPINVKDAKDEMNVLPLFVNELITGQSHPAVGKYYNRLQSISSNFEVSYPLCYVKEIFQQLQVIEAVSVLIRTLEKLECHLDTRYSGLDWECTVKVAIILRMMNIHFSGKNGLFNLVPLGTKPMLAFKVLHPECESIEEASVLMDAMLVEHKSPTLIFVDTTNAQFPQVEGFVVYTDGNPANAKKVGFQTKKSDQKPRGVMDKALINEGAWLIRGDVNDDIPRDPKDGWTYMTSKEVRAFLGNSLLLAMPRDLLEEP